MPDTYYWVARGTNFQRVDDVRNLTQANGRKGHPGAFFKAENESDLLRLDDTDCFCMTGGRDQMKQELNQIPDYRIQLRQSVGMNRGFDMWAYVEKVHLGGDRVTAIMIAPIDYPGAPTTMKKVRNPDSLPGVEPDNPPWPGTVEVREIVKAIDWAKRW